MSDVRIAEAPDPVSPDPKLYPSDAECPHCHKRQKVVFRYDKNEGWLARIEEHDLVEVLCTLSARWASKISYACPASLALVGPWEPVR